MATFWLFILVAAGLSGAAFRISDVDRVTSGKSGKDACTLSLALDWDQFEEICPIRQLATLKKQISDAKRLIKNSTALEVEFHRGLETERELRKDLQRQVEALSVQVGGLKENKPIIIILVVT